MILLVSLLCRSLSPAPKIVVDSGQYSSASQVLVCYNCWGWRHKERERERVSVCVCACSRQMLHWGLPQQWCSELEWAKSRCPDLLTDLCLIFLVWVSWSSLAQELNKARTEEQALRESLDCGRMRDCIEVSHQDHLWTALQATVKRNLYKYVRGLDQAESDV